VDHKHLEGSCVRPNGRVWEGRGRELVRARDVLCRKYEYEYKEEERQCAWMFGLQVWLARSN